MLLLIMYIIPAVLVLLNIEPLKITSIIFGICFLPGLSLLALGKRGKLVFEDLVLSFPCSLGISSLVTIGALYAGVNVKYIAYIIYGITGIIILCYILVGYKDSLSFEIKLGRSELIFLCVAFIATLVLSVPVLSERITISAHGLHHSTMVTQILNGIFPPENPGLGGTLLTYHWGHHALVAVLSSPVAFHPLRVISILNIMSLFFIFCIAYRTAKSFSFPEGYCYLLPLALIGLMRADAVIFFMNKLLSGDLMSLTHASLSEMRPLDVLQNWIWGGGAPWFDRRLFFLNKFYNANTMPLGILLCLSYFLLLLVHSENKFEGKTGIIYPFIIAFVIIASCLIYPPLAIITLLHVPLWAGVILIMNRADLKTGFKEAIKIVVPYTIAVITVLPYLLSVTSTSGEPAIRVAFWDQSIRNMVIFWLPAPLILYGAWIAFKNNSSRNIWFLLTGTLLCISLSTFTRVALWNSGKFTFILSFFYALLFVYAVSDLLQLLANRWIKGIVTAGIVLLLMITPILTEASYLVSPWFKDNTYFFSGRHISLTQDSQRNEAYTWIRNNTPPEALLILTYVEILSLNNIAQNSTYEPAALTERNLFVVKDWYTYLSPEYTKRVSMREKLLVKYTDDVRDFLLSLNRPVYLLIEKQLPGIYLREEQFNSFPDKPEGLLPVFRNESQRIYRITN